MKLRFLILASLFWGFSIFSKGLVYIVDLGVDLDLANSGKLYSEIRAGIEKMGYKPFWAHQISDLDPFDVLIFHNFFRKQGLENLRKYPKEKLVLFMWEPPTVLPNMYKQDLYDCFGRIYTWDDSLVDNKKFFKFHYPQPVMMVEYSVPFEQKKLAVMVNCDKDSRHPSSLYGKRRELIRFFEDNYPEDFDLYGRGWSYEQYKSYRGPVELRLACIKDYKFYFAYENMQNVQGYVTEKIFSALRSGSVPVYWGAENIIDYVPKNCFIDRRDFASNEELYWHLKLMSEEEYENYLQNIREFLRSDQALLFSKEYYHSIFFEAVEPGYDKAEILDEESFEIVQRVGS